MRRAIQLNGDTSCEKAREAQRDALNKFAEADRELHDWLFSNLQPDGVTYRLGPREFYEQLAKKRDDALTARVQADLEYRLARESHKE